MAQVLCAAYLCMLAPFKLSYVLNVHRKGSYRARRPWEGIWSARLARPGCAARRWQRSKSQIPEPPNALGTVRVQVLTCLLVQLRRVHIAQSGRPGAAAGRRPVPPDKNLASGFQLPTRTSCHPHAPSSPPPLSQQRASSRLEPRLSGILFPPKAPSTDVNMSDAQANEAERNVSLTPVLLPWHEKLFCPSFPAPQCVLLPAPRCELPRHDARRPFRDSMKQRVPQWLTRFGR